MSVSPYRSPLPYGGWALSFVLLLGGFFVANGSSGTAETGGDSKESSASGACHTDQEADRAQRQRELRENQTSLFDSVLDREGTGATGGGGTDGRRSRRVAPAAAGTPAAAAAAFPFASAAMGAASAARKSHLDVGTGEERRRLEREAFRVSVHEHVRRELVKTSIEDTRALAAMARVLSEDVADRQSPIVAVFTSSLLQLVHESLVALGLGFQ